MSRESALVSADWAEKNLGAAGRRLRRGRRGHHRLRRRPHPGRRQDRLEDRPAGPGPPGLRQQGSSSRRCSRPGASATTTPSSSTAATTTGSPRTRTGTSSSTATATSSCSTAAARSGSWTTARSTADAVSRPAHHATPRTTQDRSHPRVPRRGGRRDRHQEPGRRPLARRVRRPPARPRPPAAGAGAARRATSRPRCRCRGARPPTRTARSSPTTSCARSTPRPGSTTARSTIAYCRIGERSSHTWFVLQELLGHADVQELRRLVDRVRLAGRRAGGAGRRARAAPERRRTRRKPR